MINSCNNVPLIYTTSRDYQALLKLLDIVVNVAKNDIDNLISCLNADKCPSKYLPLLASYVGYDYDYSLTYDANRLIIKYYPELIRNRGNERGMLLACAIVLNISGVLEQAGDVSNYVNLVYSNNANNEVELNIYISKTALAPTLFKLIEVVRPAGLSVVTHPSLTVKSDDKVYIEDTITPLNGTVIDYNRNVVMPNDADPTDNEDVNVIGAGEINESR